MMHVISVGESGEGHEFDFGRFSVRTKLIKCYES